MVCNFLLFLIIHYGSFPQQACSKAKGSSPTAELNLLWAHNTFRGVSNYWQISQEEAGRIVSKRLLGMEKVLGYKRAT